jgi:CRISPR-associated protein Cas1
MPIKWRGTSRRPIPDNWHFIGPRSSPYHLAGNRNAAHPLNAMLNYAYAALESEIRIKAIADGFGLVSGKWRALLRERGAFHGQAAASVDTGFGG